MKVLEWQQHFSHCKAMVIIPNTQGQLNPQFQMRAACPHNLQDAIKNESATLNIDFQLL